MTDVPLKNILEAALLAAGKPLSLERMQNLFEESQQPDAATLRAGLEELAEDYAERGLELREIASGYRVQVRQSMQPWVSRLWEEKPPKYSRALLETLALIAYRQPITRGEIEDVRGVSVSSSIIKTLQEREWIRAVGHRDVPGRPAMYGTTREFLDYFNLKSLDELPTLAELRDIDSINAELNFAEALAETEANPEQASAQEQAAVLAGVALADAGLEETVEEAGAAQDAEAQTDSPAGEEAQSADDAAADSMDSDSASATDTTLTDTDEIPAQAAVDPDANRADAAAAEAEGDEDAATAEPGADASRPSAEQGQDTRVQASAQPDSELEDSVADDDAAESNETRH